MDSQNLELVGILCLTAEQQDVRDFVDNQVGEGAVRIETGRRSLVSKGSGSYGSGHCSLFVHFDLRLVHQTREVDGRARDFGEVCVTRTEHISDAHFLKYRVQDEI